MKFHLSPKWIALALMSVALTNVDAYAQPIRIKDLGRLSASRENSLVGFGLVTGLAGTGDSQRSKATRQSIANLLSRFDLAVPSDDILSRNVAVVTVTASLASYSRAGDTLDVTVTSVGDARSLAGGSLLMTPLKGPDGRVYALAQGALTVGGYRYDANNNLVQKNHPTVGLVSGGATVELGLVGERAPVEAITYVLHSADFTTAGRIADAINESTGSEVAEVRDASGIDIRVPEAFRSQIPAYMRQLETLSVMPDRQARVIVNERTGTVVTGGDVRISKVAVSHDDLKVTVEAETSVSQPLLVRQTGAGVRTQVVTNSRLIVEDGGSTKFVPAGDTTVADLVQALTRLKTKTRDIIAILQAIKAAGALHAELIIQ
ncbi:flagellar biosynthesis protein FlgI [Paucibacter sp. KBW04]|uniref:flagellar basal body P-ring protein FlgI n=1 Tax=Paucibacter sp. KBW04 TaxID=2153361 RepID=UPI000F56FDE0|nr:flagellar basal body P-ring protein FlgI [Paucibacter sp. KBW04]RQO63590.1 flagellar biosynthesis protein FlgI [Paucibacter sp. KBW04]